MKNKVLILSIIFVLISSIFVYMKNHYLFMPWEYNTSDALSYQWNEYYGEIEMFLCSDYYEDEEPGRLCIHITDEDEIKYVLNQFMIVETASTTSEEYASIAPVGDYGESFVVEISRVHSRDEYGVRDSGINLTYITFYENTTLIRAANTQYQYYYMTDELHDYILNYYTNNLE